MIATCYILPIHNSHMCVCKKKKNKDKIRTLNLMIGDILLIPYYLLHNKEYTIIKYQNNVKNQFIISKCNDIR